MYSWIQLWSDQPLIFMLPAEMKVICRRSVSPRSALEEPVIIKASSCSASLFEEFILRNGKMLSATKNIKHSQILNPRHATKTPASAVSVRSKASYFTSLLSFLKKCSLWPWQPKLLIKLNHKIAFTFYFFTFYFLE